jgi:hypothetical protein
MIRIILHLAFDRRGCRLHGRFEAHLDGRLICISRQPLLDTARILITEGIDPETPIATKHAGAEYDAMTSTIGEASKWAVQENERDGPRFVRWEAFPRDRVRAPMRFSGAPALDTWQGAERLHAGVAP